ncbi:hypothetical protein TNCV_1242151 [Trichonephila clavipes]|nr:hypothetical protein TNCV_1242151 [Trichonephila clavipes]
MNRYTYAELADIHFLYGLANGNGCVAVRLYGGRYPVRRHTNYQTFARVHQNLAENGSFRAMIDGMPFNSKMDLVARIYIAANTIGETHGIFEHVHQFMWSRCCRVCLHPK